MNDDNLICRAEQKIDDSKPIICFDKCRYNQRFHMDPQEQRQLYQPVKVSRLLRLDSKTCTVSIFVNSLFEPFWIVSAIKSQIHLCCYSAWNSISICHYVHNIYVYIFVLYHCQQLLTPPMFTENNSGPDEYRVSSSGFIVCIQSEVRNLRPQPTKL